MTMFLTMMSQLKKIILSHQLRRSSRECQISQRYPSHDYVMITDSGESEHYQKANANVDKKKVVEGNAKGGELFA
jgi:phosphatidate phosphatase APP1